MPALSKASDTVQNVFLLQTYFVRYYLLYLNFPFNSCRNQLYYHLALPIVRIGANHWPKEARASDWTTIRSTTLLVTFPLSEVRPVPVHLIFKVQKFQFQFILLSTNKIISP